VAPLPKLPLHNGSRNSRWPPYKRKLSLPVRSDSIIGITVELLEPKNIVLAVGIALLSCVQVEI